MRIIFPLLFVFVFFHFSVAEDFTVFKKDGRFGVKDGSGVVIVPAVYDQLGWSDGNKEIVYDVIGFKRNGLWGLISVKNKVLTENKFYTIAPLSEKYIKASVKGKFSNQLFYGLLDYDGEIRISFNYAELETKGDNLLAMSFDQFQSKVGIINPANVVMIPLEYRGISEQGEFLIAERANQKKDVYHKLNLVAQNLDSVKVEIGLTGFRQGKAGYLNGSGQLIHDFKFKKISYIDGNTVPVNFPNWEVRDPSNKAFEEECDSLIMVNGVWLTYYNGAQHFQFEKQSEDTREHLLEATTSNHFILSHSKTKKWSVWDNSGKLILDDQDYVEASGQHFLTFKAQKWHIYNSFGSKISSLPFKELGQAGDNFFIAKKDKYWGVIDFLGDTYITFKYDSIISTSADYYAVQFLGKWGITDRHGNWKVNPEFDQTEVFENLVVAKKGSAYSYFNDGKFLFRSTFIVKAFLDEFLLVENESGKKGLLDLDGRLVTYPSFDSIQRSGDYLVFQSGDSSAIFSASTEALVDFEEGYQAFGEIKEAYIPAKKSGRWGFIDIKGRLRIANRYEEVKAFEEGYAAIMLRGRWGFIDENEKLAVQPYYQRVSSFHGNIALVKSNGFWGLIDKAGNELVDTRWSSIVRTARGNFLVSGDDGSKGLIGADGTFILRPNYDFIQDTDLGIIVKTDGKAGLLGYDGSQVYNLNYLNIRRWGKFLMLAK